MILNRHSTKERSGYVVDHSISQSSVKRLKIGCRTFISLFTVHIVSQRPDIVREIEIKT